MLWEKASDMYASGMDGTRGLDKIDTTGVNLMTLTMEKVPALTAEAIPVGLTRASLEEFMASREADSTGPEASVTAEFATERSSTGIRGWFRRILIR